jgi:hypothetical protein
MEVTDMRKIIILLSMLSGAAIPAMAQVSIGIGMPSVSIGINFPIFPQFQPIPGYPVYYAPGAPANYFFYDGMYWVYTNDNWYASSWYNGPWAVVEPMVVPVFIYRVPVRYYVSPPVYFQGGPPDAPPQWGQHYGGDWQRQHAGWDHWDRRSAPPPAPLPTYQRQYSGSNYPSVAQQRTITTQQYHYTPKEPVIKQHFEQVAKAAKAEPAPAKPERSQRQPPPPQPPVVHQPAQASEPNHVAQAQTERKPEERKPEERKAEETKPEERKPEERKPDERAADGRKQERKPDEPGGTQN